MFGSSSCGIVGLCLHQWMKKILMFTQSCVMFMNLNAIIAFYCIITVNVKLILAAWLFNIFTAESCIIMNTHKHPPEHMNLIFCSIFFSHLTVKNQIGYIMCVGFLMMTVLTWSCVSFGLMGTTGQLSLQDHQSRASCLITQHRGQMFICQQWCSTCCSSSQKRFAR